MPARSSDCKALGDETLGKLRVRRPSVRISNQRTRSEGFRQMQSRGGMIVTMSVEQSGGIALKTAEGVTTSHTRQVSTTSTLFSPLGVSIGVVCESTTENKEVVMDVKNLSEDQSKIALDWNKTAISDNNELKKSLTSSPQELRSILSFLRAQQFEMLSALNVNSIQQLLNISLRKLLEIELSNEQLQLLLAILEKEMCTVPKSLELSADEMKSLKSIAEELEKIDANDDDDDRPLVIDENISNVEENITLANSGNERSLDEIEECFSKIRNVKIPQSQAALKGVKSELTEIIAELNGKEDKLLRQLQYDKLTPDTVNIATGVITEEVVTTTSKEQQSNKPHNSDVKQIDLTETVKIKKPVKRTNGPRTAKRRRKVNKNRNIKPTEKVTNKASGDNTTCNLTLNSNETPLTQSLEESYKISKPSSEISALGILSQSTISDVTTSVTSANPSQMPDLKVPKMSPPFSRSQGIIFINPRSVVIVHEDLAKATNIINNPITEPFNKSQFNLCANESAVLVDVSEPNSMMSSSNHLFATSNMSAITAVPLIQMDSDGTKTLSKEFVNSKLQTISKPSKSFSAVPLQQKLQPTVLIKKLPTPLRKKEHNVDADSTTTSIDLRSSKAAKMERIERKSSCAELSAKNSKTVHYPKKSKKRVVKVVTDASNSTNEEKRNYLSDISDNSCILEEMCASDRAQSAEVCETKVTQTDSEPISVEYDISDSKHGPKSVSPESPLFESIKSTTEELDESGIIKDRERSSYSDNNSSIENHKNQSHSSYSSSSPNVSPLEKDEDSRSRLSAQRRIEFDSKSGAKTEDYYDSYDADSIVTIANTPLSPISSEIASPIETNNKFRDYKPASEIYGCGVGITYLLKEIDIPKVLVNKPDDLDLLLRTNTTDPRLLKYLKKNTNALHTSSSLCVSTKIAQIDPRRPSSIYNSESYLNQRPQEPSQQTPNMLLYGCLQRSPWYQSLMSTMKIQINQTISVLVRAINNFQKIRLEDPYAVFDIFKLYCAGELLEILENLGLFVDVNGVISEKRNLSSFSGRSYGCSSVVNATYSFIQPVEPSSVTVQHQQMRSFTAPRANFSATMPNFSAPPPALQQPAPIISCYIDSPQMTMEKPVQITQPPLPRPMYSRAAPFPPSAPRRHCGLKVPYKCSPPPARSSVSPVKKQARCPDTDEECWDLDEDINSSTPSKLPLSPGSDNEYEQPHINYSRPERNDEGRLSNYGKSFGGHKKRYK